MTITNRFDITLYLFIILLCTIISCEKDVLVKDDELSLKRTVYTGNQLRINGIYYNEYTAVDSEEKHYQRYALFRNGVIRDLGGSKEIEDSKVLSGASKADWGVFEINNGEIKFERWYPSSGGAIRSYIRAGIILNDSTFKITESYRNQNGQKTETDLIDEIYYFRAFSPKPDSINSFIK